MKKANKARQRAVDRISFVIRDDDFVELSEGTEPQVPVQPQMQSGFSWFFSLLRWERSQTQEGYKNSLALDILLYIGRINLFLTIVAVVGAVIATIIGVIFGLIWLLAGIGFLLSLNSVLSPPRRRY